MAYTRCRQIKEVQQIYPNNFSSNKDQTIKNVGMSIQLKVPSQVLLQIAEQLDIVEIEEILFLCKDFVERLDIEELLDYLNEKGLLYPSGLAELLYTIKRFDLLKRHLKLGRAEAEKLLNAHPRLLPEYRVLMIDISEQLEDSDLGSLLFLLKDYMSTRIKLKHKTFLSLVIDLEKMNLLAPDNVDLLERSLQTIHRVDLKNKVCRYKQAGNITPSRSYINITGTSPSVQVTLTPPSVRQTNGTHYSKGVSVPVQESGACYQTELSDKYILKNRGLCIIIDCIGNDADMLEKTFRSLDFNIKRYMYVTMDDLRTILQNVTHMEDLKSYDMFVCCLISRGSPDSVFCVDHSFPGYPLERVKDFFTGRSCPALVGKPKLFFIQNYIVNESDEPSSEDLLEEDGPSFAPDAHKEAIYLRQKIPNEADILWSHCKVDERELCRSSGSVSSYLSYLSELLTNKQNRKQHLLDIHTELNNIVYSKKQGYSLQLRHTLTKKLFLPPC